MLLLWICTTVLIHPAPVESEWLTDMAEARQIAKRENKYILVNFSGSDWCGWCKRLDREVFSKSAFREFAAKKLVLLSVDFPKRKQQSSEQKVANRKLKREYGVRGYPSILLINAKGRVVLRTGYVRGGAENYVDHLRQEM